MIDRILTSAMVSAAALVAVACAPDGEAASAVSPEAAVEAEVTAPTGPAAVPASPLPVEDACRQAVQAQFGQEGPAVTFIDGVISWRAPVDGGHLNFTCAVDGNAVSLTRDGETQVVTLNTAADSSAQQEAH